MPVSKVPWTAQEIETLKFLVAKHNDGHHIDWKGGVFADPEGQALLHGGRTEKDVQNRWTWYERGPGGNKPAPPSHQLRRAVATPAPVTASHESKNRGGGPEWSTQEIQLLQNLHRRFPRGKHINWKRAEAEAPDVWQALTANRTDDRVKAKWYYIMAADTREKNRVAKNAAQAARRAKKQLRENNAHAEDLPVQIAPDTSGSDGLAPNHCYNCGAPLVIITKGLEIYRKHKQT